MANDFEVFGVNSNARFSLRAHRGDGMVLLAMNWKAPKPPMDFVGFGIEYKIPNGDRFFTIKNRLSFDGVVSSSTSPKRSTLVSPIQKFRWVHFPRNAELEGDFEYRVTPVFMNDHDELSYGEAQTVKIALQRETYPKKLNVTFTRGFVSSQAFLDRYVRNGASLKLLMPKNASEGLDFQPTHPEAKEALEWMGFEARHAVLEILDEAIADATAEVRVVAYDLSEKEVFFRLKKLGKRLKIIIDDSAEHGKPESGESKAAAALTKTAGKDNVLRQHMSGLQHNKTIVVSGSKVKAAVCGSTNFTWRGFYVQNNHAVVVRGAKAIKPFLAAFDHYWNNSSAATFGATDSTEWHELGLNGIDGWITFSPHSISNARLEEVAADIESAKSSVFYSLAFLHQTRGAIPDAIEKITKKNSVFTYGMSDKKIGGLDLQKPDGTVVGIGSSYLKTAPAPFRPEDSGGMGTRLHHKFIVLDFDTPDARVYFGSYNFSNPADKSNGENLVYVKDRRIAVSFMVEAIRLFDHYHFRVAQSEKPKTDLLHLKRPPRGSGAKAWWEKHYSVATKIQDRLLFG
jgi:hypothetical protein